jgi:secreted trypsin-like serine protease
MSRGPVHGLASVAALALLGACSSSSDGGAPAGSVDATGHDAGVVAIVSPNGDPTYVCSAEAIAPRVILTAAHCFRGGNYDKTGWVFDVFVGADVHAPASSGRRIRVAEFRLHPDYGSGVVRADGSDGDIAVAFVGEDLGVALLSVHTAPLPSSLEGVAGRYVGFGDNDPTRKGKRHSEPARVLSVSPAVLAITASRIPCHGDSGGPLLLSIDGRETVAGVGHTSQIDSAGNCVTSATYTRTDLFADFVRAAMP